MKWNFILVLIFHCQSYSITGLVLTTARNQSSNVLEHSHFSAPTSTRAASRVKSQFQKQSSGALHSSNEDGMSAMSRTSRLPKFLFVLNSATKWIVSLAVTVGVWWNPRRYHGPYIVVGSIVANYLGDVLKKVINQGRPDGAPFADPGMPSTHAVVSFFVAMAWRDALSGQGGGVMLGAAFAISLLRVICGYHTVPQIAVGSIVGVTLAHAWMMLGAICDKGNGRATFALSWASYLIGSAIYIHKKAIKWFTDEKHL